jgi:hypothetical protein
MKRRRSSTSLCARLRMAKKSHERISFENQYEKENSKIKMVINYTSHDTNFARKI